MSINIITDVVTWKPICVYIILRCVTTDRVLGNQCHKMDICQLIWAHPALHNTQQIATALTTHFLQTHDMLLDMFENTEDVEDV